MYTFLDESGLHLKAGHTVFALVFIKPEDMATIEAAFSELQSRINVSSLHWSDMAWTVRQKVFASLKDMPFEFKIAVLNNPITNNLELVTQVLSQLLSAEKGQAGAIYIDGKKSRHYVARLHKALREAGVQSRKLKTVTDVSYPGVQIADAIAGVYRHQLDKPSDNSARLQRKIASKQK